MLNDTCLIYLLLQLLIVEPKVEDAAAAAAVSEANQCKSKLFDELHLLI